MSSTSLCPLIDPLNCSIDDALQTAWQAIRREENRTESDTDRQRLERLRGRLSELMKELETQR